MNAIFRKINQTKVFRDLTEKEFSWVLYDVGNSAYTMLACSLIPIWFKNLAAATNQISSDQATAYYSISIAVCTIIVALLGPMCGAIADRKDMKKLFFSTTVAIGVIGCIINGFANNWLLFIVLFVLTQVSYNASLVFYDSMLGDVTEEERMDQVSAYGYAWGYIGSCIPFAGALIGFVLGPGNNMLNLIPEMASRLIGFGITAIWWLYVSLPLIKGYKQINYVENTDHAIGEAFGKLFTTLRKIIIGDKKVFFFLIAFFLYIDGVGTIIDNAINIGTDLNLDQVGQVVFLLATQVVAFGGSLVFAKLSKKYDTATLIRVCIIGYFFVCLYALTLSSLIEFGILAFGIGCFQGSIQSMSRSYFAKIIPAENSGEYFGIYDIFAKGASFLGSFVIAGVKLAGGTINVAVATMAIFFALGFVFMRIAEKQ